MTFDLRREALLWTILLAPILYLMLVWGDLPERVPIHWNAAGEIDGWSSKKALPWMVGGLQVFLYLLMRLLPYIDPRASNLEASRSAYQKLRVVLGLLFGFIGFLMVHSALHQQLDLPGWLLPGLFFFFAAIGNYLVRLRSNYFVGIRTPWTLEYPENWERTHRFGGRLWFWGGLIGGILGFLLPAAYLKWMIILLLVLVFAPILYSFVLFKKGVGSKAATGQ
ncbi:MAG: SdpI family protein [Flavobacteriales bacterium]|nr:SdpI family protein [Flavobacteriales bacterium]